MKVTHTMGVIIEYHELNAIIQSNEAVFTLKAKDFSCFLKINKLWSLFPDGKVFNFSAKTF
jgi:hypothetical protein